MSIEENKALVNRMTEEFWNTGNKAAIGEFFSADSVNHGPSGLTHIEQLKQSAAAHFAGFPDLHITVDEVIAEGDKVVKRWTARCTHTGDFMGVPATGNKLEITGTTTYRVAGGKFVESWWNTDTLGMMQQMGVIPPLGEGASQSSPLGHSTTSATGQSWLPPHHLALPQTVRQQRRGNVSSFRDTLQCPSLETHRKAQSTGALPCISRKRVPSAHLVQLHIRQPVGIGVTPGLLQGVS